MPFELTFNTLQTTLQAYLERGTATDTAVYNQLPMLINQAERRIARDLKVLGFQQVLTNTMSQGVAVLQKPDRWRETISFNYGNFNPVTNSFSSRTPIYPRSYEFIRALWPDDSIVDKPRYFADYNFSNWVLAPTPDQAYPFEVLFWELPALLDNSNQTNWTTTYAPELLVYSALLECTPFLKNDERIPTWVKLYEDAKGSLATENIQDIVSRGTQTRQTVTPMGRSG